MEAVETLINLGSNLNDRDNDGYSPLHVATRMRNTGIVQILLNANANCNITDDNGLTSLHMAASQGCKGILESIIDYCPDIINKQCNVSFISYFFIICRFLRQFIFSSHILDKFWK